MGWGFELAGLGLATITIFRDIDKEFLCGYVSMITKGKVDAKLKLNKFFTSACW